MNPSHLVQYHIVIVLVLINHEVSADYVVLNLKMMDPLLHLGHFHNLHYDFAGVMVLPAAAFYLYGVVTVVVPTLLHQPAGVVSPRAVNAASVIF